MYYKINNINTNNKLKMYNEKYEKFRMDADKVGGFLILKTRLMEKESLFGLSLYSLTDKEAWVIFGVGWYDKSISPTNTYKAKLTPMGPFSHNMSERNMYCSDIESSLRDGHGEYFENPFEALDVANSRNAELYPEYSEYFGVPKKLNKLQTFIKKLFRL